MKRKRKIVCPFCGRPVKLNTTGLIPRHQRPGQRSLITVPVCFGSGKTVPDAASRAAQRAEVWALYPPEWELYLRPVNT